MGLYPESKPVGVSRSTGLPLCFSSHPGSSFRRQKGLWCVWAFLREAAKQDSGERLGLADRSGFKSHRPCL